MTTRAESEPNPMLGILSEILADPNRRGKLDQDLQMRLGFAVRDSERELEKDGTLSEATRTVLDKLFAEIDPLLSSKR